MNKQELQNKISDLEKQLAEVKSQLDSVEDESKNRRWKPEYEEDYYYIDSFGVICKSCWLDDFQDLFRFNVGNCFKTEQESEDYKENLLTKQALKDLALELNGCVKIDWKNASQQKFSIFAMCQCFLHQEDAISYTNIGQVYCLNENFLTIAKDHIGEEKLIKLIKSGV